MFFSQFRLWFMVTSSTPNQKSCEKCEIWKLEIIIDNRLKFPNKQRENPKTPLQKPNDVPYLFFKYIRYAIYYLGYAIMPNSDRQQFIRNYFPVTYSGPFHILISSILINNLRNRNLVKLIFQTLNLSFTFNSVTNINNCLSSLILLNYMNSFSHHSQQDFEKKIWI